MLSCRAAQRAYGSETATGHKQLEEQQRLCPIKEAFKVLLVMLCADDVNAQWLNDHIIVRAGPALVHVGPTVRDTACMRGCRSLQRPDAHGCCVVMGAPSYAGACYCTLLHVGPCWCMLVHEAPCLAPAVGPCWCMLVHEAPCLAPAVAS